MIETNDIEMLLRFCDRDHVRCRRIIHALASPCPDWDDAMARSDYVEGKGFVAMALPSAEPEDMHFFVDRTDPVGLLVWAQGRHMTVEGRVRGYDGFAAWCREAMPASVQTTDPTIAACLDQTLDLDGWADCGAEYAVDAEAFVPRTTGTVKQLTPEDRPLWRQFVQEYAHEPMVNSRPGSQAAFRDFEFMCMGLPVRYYVALDDGRIAGFLTVNTFTSQADEIAAVFVPPEKRRRGYGASLLSAAVQDILDAGRLPAYHAGGAPDTRPDLFRMLTGLGFHLVAIPREAAVLS